MWQSFLCPVIMNTPQSGRWASDCGPQPDNRPSLGLSGEGRNGYGLGRWIVIEIQYVMRSDCFLCRRPFGMRD